ncbi:MAG: DUF5060 domain-containing protein [Lachnospiraceae bacterium]|nr:DUF5060 domain-containing protein [Lachnospiraceae bacterium]MDD3616217.1 DUF5060 domain-containing protein [Lachnospiraceae bacterium]
MIQFKMFELSFKGNPPSGSEAEVDVTAVFKCEKEEKTVKGFYDGDGTYKVRFLPQQTGHYTWEVSGVVIGSGQEDCTTSKKYHGLIQVEGNHFIYEDGTRYLPFGTTIYALAHQSEELIAQTMETLKKAPFNKVRHCVFPKHYDYNHNEPEFFAFEKDENGNWDVNRPCFKFWKHFESIIDKLAGMDIQSDLILFHPYDRWGLSKLTMEENRIYLDYLLRRLSANPNVWWSLANEYDLVFTRKMEDWYAFEEQVAAEDAYHHLLSNHNCFALYDFNRKNVTHCSIQSTQLYKGTLWQKKFGKPVIYDECCYEGDLELNWGNLSAFDMADRFWRAFAVGAYATHGEVYLSDDEILWWARGGILKGESPVRIAFLKRILEELPGALEPWEVTRYISENAGNEDKNQTPEEKANNPFLKLINNLTPDLQEMRMEKSAMYTGHYKDEVFLRYFARECNSNYHLRLPKTGNYKIEVIDIWEMTRIVYAENTSGDLIVKLPGKPGIAVLAKSLVT